ncbi:MAG: glycosyltransferase [bacterium]
MKIGKVGIVIRTKDRPLFLKRALEDILNQTFTDWSLVIVNDYGDREILEKLVDSFKSRLGERYSIIYNETNLKLGASATVGFKALNTEYSIIHDDDDTWHPQFLEKCVDFLDNKPNSDIAGVVVHSLKIIEQVLENEIKPLYNEIYNSHLSALISLYRIAIENVFPPTSFLYKTSVFKEIGYYDEKLEFMEDWEFNLRFLSKFEIAVIPETLCYYHQRCDVFKGDFANSVISNESTLRFYETHIRNRMLRNDIQEGKTGLGFLVNMAKSIESGFMSEERSRVDLIKVINNPEIKDRFNNFVENNSDKKICFYGAGKFAQEIIRQFDTSKLNIIGFIDQNPQKIGQKIGEYEIFGADKIKELSPDIIALAVLQKNTVIPYLSEIIKKENLKTEIEQNLFV